MQWRLPDALLLGVGEVMDLVKWRAYVGNLSLPPLLVHRLELSAFHQRHSLFWGGVKNAFVNTTCHIYPPTNHVLTVNVYIIRID